MEKKNMVLLTIIAVATLLVAVVGATFAYFTASVTETSNSDVASDRRTSVTTETMVNAVMELGSGIVVTDVYPGHKDVKTVHVTGTGTNANSKEVDATITVTPNIPAAFGNDVTWTLYEVNGEPTITPYTNTKSDVVVAGVRQYSETATGYTRPAGATAVANMTGHAGTTAATHRVQVGHGFDKTYILEVEYANNGVQNADGASNQSGLTYTVDIGFAATPSA